MVRQLAALFAVCGLMAGAYLAGQARVDHDPYSQRAFPCAEDQALAFDPAFGPDAVGCIQREG